MCHPVYTVGAFGAIPEPTQTAAHILVRVLIGEGSTCPSSSGNWRLSKRA
jgi:hypothetical protein